MLRVLSAFIRLSYSEYFCPETAFSASDHRQIFTFTNDYFLPLLTCFLIFSSFFSSSLFLSSLLSIADYISYSRFRQRPRRMSASVSIFFLRSSCFGIGFAFSLLVDTACCKSVGESYDDDD